MHPLPLPANFLGSAPALEDRWQALCLNVQAWYERQARADGKEVKGHAGELLWTPSQLTIPSEEALEDDQQIESILDWYRRQQPLRGAIWWYLHPKPPINLGARLFARGVGPNWEPHWMWCELRRLQSASPHASTFEIRRIGAEALSSTQRKRDPMLAALVQMYPRQVWRVRAVQQGKGVGSCLLNVTTGEWGVGGLFDMWVKPQSRKQGIGTALAQATCELARQLGCHHVVLNATEMGEPVYRRVGFESMGYGRTWFGSEEMLAAPAPTKEQVRFLEAIGLGEQVVLDEQGKQLTELSLQESTLNGLTPLEIAVRLQQAASAAWLVEHGVIPDILSAWDLGWKEVVPALLDEHPDLIKRRGGRWTATPLHSAIERDDRELVEVLLTVPNDLESTDGVFGETPLQWARRLQRQEILILLKQARVRQRHA